MTSNETNVSVTSELESTPILIATIVLIPICTAIFVLNVLALAVLSKSKKLKQNRFHRLTLYLSISNIISSISSLFLIADLLIRLQDVHVPYICSGSTLVTSITVLFSLVQVLFICFERLLATFPRTQANKWSNVYDFLGIGSFVITGAYCSMIHILFEDKQTHGCDMKSLFGDNLWKFQFSLGIVHLTIFTIISIVYALVVRRLRKMVSPLKPTSRHTDSLSQNLTSVRHNTTGPQNNNKNQQEETSIGGRDQRVRSLESSPVDINRAQNFHCALYTLGIIISVMIVSSLLPVIMNLMSAITADVFSPDILTYVNGLFMINPLCDPIIYVLRIKEFRSMITCCK
ncbi:unnamed protein product [Mytilus coruscus]|uniref:G-protein coupled receptors family 1 profile domain-containing protein n=1 Tax=Mytilus coruscus TaxID=42192 RepID=A0A6J8ADM6_MYTCO|nr:unnamed protein product [Mytilus coruscus]